MTQSSAHGSNGSRAREERSRKGGNSKGRERSPDPDKALAEIFGRTWDEKEGELCIGCSRKLNGNGNDNGHSLAFHSTGGCIIKVEKKILAVLPGLRSLPTHRFSLDNDVNKKAVRFVALQRVMEELLREASPATLQNTAALEELGRKLALCKAYGEILQRRLGRFVNASDVTATVRVTLRQDFVGEHVVRSLTGAYNQLARHTATA